MAHLPVALLVDPDAVTDDGWLSAECRDAVRPERLGAASTVVAGWGDLAWRASVRVVGSDYEVSQPPDDMASWAPSPGEWSERAHRVLDALLPVGVDEQTRVAAVKEILEIPLRDLRRQNRVLLLLLGAYRTLRRSARRTLLQTVAHHHLGSAVPPHTSPTWQLLARLTRTPNLRLAGQTSHAVLLHDSRPQCPTALRWTGG